MLAKGYAREYYRNAAAFGKQFGIRTSGLRRQHSREMLSPEASDDEKVWTIFTSVDILGVRSAIYQAQHSFCHVPSKCHLVKANMKTLPQHQLTALRRIVLPACLIPLLLFSIHGQVELTVRTGHLDSIRSLTFSRDGQHLATVGDDQTVRIWDLHIGKELRALRACDTATTAVALSPNKELLASVCHGEGLVKVWRIKDGSALWSSEAHAAKYNYSGNQRHTIAFTSDGKYLVVGRSSDRYRTGGTVGVPTAIDLDLPPPQPVPPLRLKDESPENYEKRYQAIIDKAAKEAAAELEQKKRAKQEKILRENTIDIWNVDNGTKAKQLTGHTGGVPFVTLSRDRKTIISGSDDKTIRIWDFESGTERLRLGGFRDSIQYITTSRNDRFLACLLSPETPTTRPEHEKHEIKIWDLSTSKEIRSFTIEGASLIEFDPANEEMLLNISTWRIDFFNIGTGQKVATLERFENQWVAESDTERARARYEALIKKGEIKIPRPRPLFAEVIAAFDSSGQFFALSDGEDIHVWNWPARSLIAELNSKIHPLGTIVLSPSGKILAIEEDGFQLTLLNLQSGARRKNIGHSSANPVFSSNSRLIVLCDQDYGEDGSWEKTTSTIKVFNAQTGRMLKAFRTVQGSVNKLLFAPSDKLIASEDSHDDTLTIWDIESRMPLHSLSAPFSGTKYPRLITFSADSKRILFSDYGTLKSWDFEANVVDTLRSEGFPNRIAFSKDGNWTVESDTRDALFLQNLKTGVGWFWPRRDPVVIKKLLELIPEYYQNNEDDVVSPDGKWRVIKTSDGRISFVDFETGRELASFSNLGDNWLGAEGSWLVTTPEGFFDGAPRAWKEVFWRFNNDTFDFGALELYFNDFFHPNLLRDALAGRAPKPPIGRKLEEIDRRQPQVEFRSINGKSLSNYEPPEMNRPTTDQRIARLVLQVTDNVAEKKQVSHPESCGAFDLRLFRNGSLVKVWHGDAFNLGAAEGCEQVPQSDQTQARQVRCQADAPVVAGINRFTGYVFNSSKVKSSDAHVTLNGAESLKRSSTLYVLAIGVGKYASAAFNLSYSAADAREFAAEFQLQQERIGSYQRVEVRLLLDQDAKKANILAQLKTLRAKIQPEDALVVYFSGHGASRDDRYYLIPHDLGYSVSRRVLNTEERTTILAHSISDLDLESAFQDIDAGRILLIIDSCHSGQALEAEQDRVGPMNSRGLAQLAYEKGMYVLTASQAVELAFESSRLKHSYLTYALVQEGLKSRLQEADENGDGEVRLKEWLDYAVQRVPEMRAGEIEQIVRSKNKSLDMVENAEQGKVQTPRVFYRTETEPLAWVIANTKSRSPLQK
jgi:WD40 repeat protein